MAESVGNYSSDLPTSQVFFAGMAVSGGNCSSDLPTSQVFFEEISTTEKVGVIGTSAACVAIIGLFLDQARFVIRKYKTVRENPELKIKSLWLLGIYPVFSTMALLAVYVPRAVLLCDLASSVYLAVCLFHFTTLIIVYAGGIQSLLDKVEDHSGGFTLRTPPCCCCCCCCPIIRPSWTNLRRVRLMVFQNTFIEPFISFLILVLWLDEKYVPGQMGATTPGVYLLAIRATSTLTAMYGLSVLYWSSREFLTKHCIRPKYFVMKMVLLLHNFQGFVFLVLAKKNVPPCSGVLSSNVRGDAVRHMVVVGEMFLLALLARRFYRRPHGSHHEDDEDDDALSTGSEEHPRKDIAIVATMESSGNNKEETEELSQV